MLLTPDAQDPAEAWPKLSAPQWEQVRRLIADLDKQTAGPESDEQRTSPRRAVAFPVRFVVNRSSQQPGQCWAVVRNISCGGVSAMVRRMFHLNDRLVVQLPVPDGPPRSVNARVLRCRYIGDLYHEVGLTFLAGGE